MVPVGQVISAIGGPDFVEAVRLQLEASLVPGLDPLGNLIDGYQDKYLKLALGLGGRGVAVFAEAVPRIRAQRAENKKLAHVSSEKDPVDALAHAVRRLVDENPELRAEIALLRGSLKDPAQLAVLQQLRRAIERPSQSSDLP